DQDCDINAAVQRASLRIAVGSGRMCGAVAGGRDDATHRYVVFFPQILRYRGGAISAQLLIFLLGSGTGGISGDLNHVALERERNGGQLVEVRFRGSVEN